MTGKVSRAAARAAAKDHGIRMEDVDAIMARSHKVIDLSKLTVEQVRSRVGSEFAFLDREYAECHPDEDDGQ